MDITLTLCTKETRIASGLTQVKQLYKVAKESPDEQWLYLDRERDIDIPLLPDEHIILHGGEKIFSGKPSLDISKNPKLRCSICPIFNDKKLNPGIERAKISGAELQQRDTNIPSIRLFVDIEGGLDQFISPEMILVIQDTDSYFTVPTDQDGAIELEECAIQSRRPPKGVGHVYRIRIDSQKHKVTEMKMVGKDILHLAGKTYDEWTMNQKLKGGRRVSIEKEQLVDLSVPGVERFETAKRQAQQG